MSKFTMVGRHKLEASVVDIFGDTSTAQYSLSKVRSKVRTFLLKIAAGEYIHDFLYTHRGFSVCTQRFYVPPQS